MMEGGDICAVFLGNTDYIGPDTRRSFEILTNGKGGCSRTEKEADGRTSTRSPDHQDTLPAAD
jgi:hypothetical protein